MRHFVLVILTNLALTTTSAHADGFTKELFESWLSMRTGGGETDVYWYSEGLVKSFPEGSTTAKMIGFDTSHLLRDRDNPNKAVQLSRKIFYFFDPETGERINRQPIAYPHQVIFFFVVRDSYPVTKYHSLIIPHRHVSNFFDLNDDELLDLNKIIKQLKRLFIPSLEEKL